MKWGGRATAGAFAVWAVLALGPGAGVARATDGDLDPAFGDGGVVRTRLGTRNGHGRAAAALRQPDGKLVLAGWGQFSDLDFTLARYNADGSVDATFGGGSGMVTTQFTNAAASAFGTDQAFAIALQADGKLVAAGSAGVNGTTDFALARYHADGSLDTSFGDDGRITTSLGSLDDVVSALVVQPDGKLVVAGSSETSLATRDLCLVRYAADGSLDASFGAGGIVRTPMGTSNSGLPNSAAESLILQPDGTLVAAGWAGGSGTTSSFAVARYLSDGSLDASFGTGGIATTAIDLTAAAKTVIRQSDGKLVAAGYKYVTGGPGTPEAFALVRYEADGSLDASFGSGGIVVTQIGQHDIVWGLVQQADGKLVAAGQTAPTYGNPSYDFAVARYQTNGALDTSFGVAGKRTTDIANGDVARALLLQSDGKLIAAGYAYTGWDTFALARYTTSGALDASFASAGTLTTVVGRGADTAAALVRQADGKLVAAGTASSGLYTDFGLVRYDADGALDAGFGSGGALITPVSSTRDSAAALLLQADGKLVAAGRAAVGSNDNFALARYHADGTADAGFGSAGKVTTAIGTGDDFVTAIVQQGDGKLVVAGSYVSNSFDFLALARYLANGTLDSSFGSAGKVLTGTTGTARGLALQPDGKLVLAAHDYSLRRYLVDGSLDPTFGNAGTARANFPAGNQRSYGLTLQPDGKLVLVGHTVVTGTNYDLALARFNPDGSLDASFGSGGMQTTAVGPGQAWAETVAYQPDGKLAVAGRIMAANGGYADVLLARYGADGTLDPTFGSAGVVTTPLGPNHDYALALLWQPDGKLAAAGVGRDAFGNEVFTLLRYAANVCGDGTVAAGEQCDAGAANGTDASCCSAACALRAAEHACRPAGGGCDVAELCSGASPECPADVNPACTPTATASATATETPPPTATPTAPPTATASATSTATSTQTAAATATEPPTATPTATHAPVRCDAAAPQNSCIPGGGARGSDCVLELEMRPVPPLLANGLPKNRATCHEGDPACDSDADLADGRCVFALRLCINNADPRLAACVPSALHSVEVMRPKATSSDPADVANLASLVGQAGGAAGGFGVTVLDSRRTIVAAGVPNATPDLCSDPLPMQVPMRRSAGGALLRQRRVVQLRAHTAALADRDKLTLECRPSTCGNGAVEADHETCDDGNRFNGDGCDQGCRIE